MWHYLGRNGEPRSTRKRANIPYARSSVCDVTTVLFENVAVRIAHQSGEPAAVVAKDFLRSYYGVSSCNVTKRLRSDHCEPIKRKIKTNTYARGVVCQTVNCLTSGAVASFVQANQAMSASAKDHYERVLLPALRGPVSEEKQAAPVVPQPDPEPAVLPEPSVFSIDLSDPKWFPEIELPALSTFLPPLPETPSVCCCALCAGQV